MEWNGGTEWWNKHIVMSMFLIRPKMQQKIGSSIMKVLSTDFYLIK